MQAHNERRQYRELTQTEDMRLKRNTLGDIQADALAAEGARRLALPEPLQVAAREGSRLSLAIMQRLVRIEEAHWPCYGADTRAGRRLGRRVSAAEALRVRLKASGHRLLRFGQAGEALKCLRCGKVVGMPTLSAWLSAHPCPGQAVVRQGKLGFVSDPFSVATRYRGPCGCTPRAGADGGDEAVREGAEAAAGGVQARRGAGFDGGDGRRRRRLGRRRGA